MTFKHLRSLKRLVFITGSGVVRLEQSAGYLTKSYSKGSILVNELKKSMRNGEMKLNLGSNKGNLVFKSQSG